MKQFLLILSFILLSIYLSAQGNKKGGLQLISKETIAEPETIELFNNEFYEQPIADNNPLYNGLILISKNDNSISFAVLDNKNKVLLKKPAESTFITLSPISSKYAAAGKKTRAGYKILDQAEPCFGFSVMDGNGNKIFSDQVENKILQMEFNSNDQLIVLSTGGLICYDITGKISWSIHEIPDEFSLSSDLNIITSIRFDARDSRFHKIIINSTNGNKLKEWVYYANSETGMYYCSLENNQAFISVFNGNRNPVNWNLEIIDLNNNEAPIASLNEIEAVPFYASFIPSKKVYVFIMARPRIANYKNGGEIIFAEWSMTDKSLKQISLGYQDVLYSRDKAAITYNNSIYKIEIGREVYLISN